MPDKSDGSVIIDTSLDLEGVTKAAKEFLKVIDDMVSKGNKTFNGFVVHFDGIKDAEKDLEALNKRLEDLTETRSDVAKSFQDASEEFGEDSEQADALREALDKLDESIRINAEKADDLSDAINNARKSQEKATRTTKEYGNATSDASDKTEKLSNEQGNNTKKVGAMQIAIGNLISRGVEKLITGMIDLIDKTREFRKEMSVLEHNALRTGTSMEVAQTAMKDFYFVTGETDESLEGVSNLLATGFDENSLTTAVEALSGAVLRFPDTFKLGSLANSLQETLAKKEATGEFAELLNRLGVSTKDYNETIAAMTDEESRNYALRILQNRGLVEEAEAYEKRNVSLRESSDAQFELNQAMADIGSALEPLQTEVMKTVTDFLKNNSDLVKVVSKNVAGLADTVLRIIGVLGSIPAPVWIIIGTIVTLVGTFVTMMKTVKEVTGIFKPLGAGFSAVDDKMMKTTAIIVGIVIALIALAVIIAVLAGKSNELERSMNTVGNSVGKIQDNISNAQEGNRVSGYAKGTESAKRGWNLVGESGPELLYFDGGEKVLNANQTMAMRLLGSGASSQNYYFSGDIVLDARNVKDFNDVVTAFKTARQFARAR